MPDPHDVTWDRWDEVDSLFERALDLAEGQRERFLADACGGDQALLDAVRALLGARDRVPDGLASPSTAFVRAALSGSRDSDTRGLEPGDRVGRYRVLTELGRGGMATVYEAERADGAFERRVALKVLRRGLDTDALVGRFRVERQILSGLAHPNIATLLDGGATDDGRPFLVMELVSGETITDWARRHELSITARVELFLQVVDAVGFAHGHLVVHRDLKPSNVLVTDAGQVKLLDFGVAKLLDSATPSGDELTRIGPAPMTPEFASPEQIRGDRVTTASDVFQLGALLYRLLTGARPFEDGAARLRGAGDVPVRRPSDAAGARSPRARSLRGDLDTIVLKALRPEPELRYGSAGELGADLRRYLGGRPVTARPASRLYRLRKFSGRNPWFWPVAAVLAIGFGGYLATVLRYSHRLEIERNQAVAEAQRAEAIRSFMVNQFGAADPYSDDPVRPDVTVVEALALGAESARRELAGQPLLQAEMLSAIARVYSNLSLSPQALELLDEAMALRRAHGAEDSPEQIEDLGRLGSILGGAGQRDSARVLLLESLKRERATFGNDDPRTADALDRLGWHYWYDDAEFGQAVTWYEEAAQIRRSTEPIDVAALSSTLAALGDSYRSVGRWDEARRVAIEAYEIARDEFGEENPITAGNKGHLAQVVHGMGDLEQAISLYREALPVLERTLGSQHSNTLSNWNNLGIVLDQAGDLVGAEEVHRRILAIRRERYGTDQHRHIATSFQNLAAVLVQQGRLVEADSLARRAEEIFRAVLGDNHYSVAFSLITQAEVGLRQGQGRHAERVARQAIRILEPRFGSGYPTAAARCRLGRALALQGRVEQAESVLAASLQEMERGEGVPEREVRSCRDGWVNLREARGS